MKSSISTNKFLAWWGTSFFLLFFFIKPMTIHLWYLYGTPRPCIPFLAAIMIASILAVIIINNNYFKYSFLSVIISILLIYIMTLQVINLPIAIQYGGLIIYLKTIGMTIFGYSGFFLTGLFFLSIFDNKNIKKTIILIWIFFTVFELLQALKNSQGFYISLTNEAGFYLILSDSYAYLTILTIALCDKPKIQYFILLIGIITLSTLLSRASIIIFLICSSIFILIKSKRLFLILLLIIVFTFITSSNGINMLKYKLPISPRLIQLIELGTETPGWIARKELLSKNSQKITLLGDFMGEVRDNWGFTGSYIHNILSYARQYGIVVFMAICAILIFQISLYCFLICRRSSHLTNFDYFCLLFVSYNIVSAVLARGYTDPSLWMSLGLLSTAIKQKQLGYPGKNYLNTNSLS